MASQQPRLEPEQDRFPLLVSAEEAIAALENGALLVDIRSGAGREKFGYFDVGIAVEKDKLLTAFSPRSRQRQPDLPKDQPILFFCGNESTAMSFVELLRKVGLVNARNVIGGYDALCRAGMPVHDKAQTP